ncbi:MAG: Methionine--tRNA ligase [Acidimicrobiia bacterium]|nr:Methionine--tRNA ligase [Acidimicrobiia bacterium]
MPRYLITSALPYINGVKHLGNLVGSMLPADVYARHLRARGEEVLFICATDEHGTPAELAARDAGLDVAEFCRQQHDIQAAVCAGFGLSWDHFGRTSRVQNHEITQHFADRLDAQGLIEERTTTQLYSVADERFLPDRYVVGTCPNCGYDRARGDQCENCTRQLNPTDLINPRSAISGSPDVELRESKHLYFLQSKLAPQLREWIDSQSGWPLIVTSIARKWLDEGLEDRSITRDLSWGIPVNRPGFEGKVFYVWFDAPIGYISSTKEWADLEPGARDWESWWRTDKGADDVQYVEFMAKDNVPFHTLSFPATIIGSGEPWKLVDYIKGFNWLTYYGGKFSTTDSRGVFMDTALDLLPADYWRWYLIANAPESDDTAFTWELFGDSVNKELVGTFGNFLNRTVAQVTRHFGEVVPAGGEPTAAEKELAETLSGRIATYLEHLDRLEFRRATSELRALWAEGNVYLESQRPWELVKTDRDGTARVLRTALGLARTFAVLAAPIIPTSAQRVLDAFQSPAPTLAEVIADPLSPLPAGQSFTPPGLLFQKLDPTQLAEWGERFGTAG